MYKVKSDHNKECIYIQSEERVNKKIIKFMQSITHSSGQKAKCPDNKNTKRFRGEFLFGFDERH